MKPQQVRWMLLGWLSSITHQLYLTVSKEEHKFILTNSEIQALVNAHSRISWVLKRFEQGNLNETLPKDRI